MGDAAGAYERFDEALAQLDSSSTTPVKRASLHVGLGRALDELGELESAADAYETALRLSPGHSEALTYFPRTLAQHRDALDRALSLARQAVAEADSPSAHATLGWILHLRGDNKEAVDSFKTALERGASSAWTYERLGDVYNALGNEALARRYWNEALDRSRRPDSLKKKLKSVPQS